MNEVKTHALRDPEELAGMSAWNLLQRSEASRLRRALCGPMVPTGTFTEGRPTCERCAALLAQLRAAPVLEGAR